MADQIRIILNLDDAKFSTSIKRSSKSLNTLGKNADRATNRIDRAERSIKSFGKGLRDVSVTLASLNYLLPNLSAVIFGWQNSIIKANASLEQSIAVMKNFSTATSDIAADLEARNFVDIITKKAMNAPFSINALTDSFVKMKSGGIDPLAGSLDSLTDAVAAFGGTDETLKRASIAIQQMSGKGVVSMEELRQQLGEAVPNAINLMAKSLGVTYAELVKEISKGTVSAKPAIEAMMKEMERSMGGTAMNMMTTWNGLTAQMITSWTVLMRELGGGGDGDNYFKALKDELEGILTLMKSTQAKIFMRDLGDGLKTALGYLKDLVVFLYKNSDAILAITASYVGLKIAMAAYNGMFAPIIASVSSFNASRAKTLALSAKLFTAETRDALFQKSKDRSVKLQIAQMNAQRIAMGRNAITIEQMSNSQRRLIRETAISTATTRVNTLQVRAAAVANAANATALRSAGTAIKGLASTLAIFAIPMLIGWLYQLSQTNKELDKSVAKLREMNGQLATSETYRALVKQNVVVREQLELARDAEALDEKIRQARNKVTAKGSVLKNTRGGGTEQQKNEFEEAKRQVIFLIGARDKYARTLVNVSAELEKLNAVEKLAYESLYASKYDQFTSENEKQLADSMKAVRRLYNLNSKQITEDENLSQEEKVKNQIKNNILLYNSEIEQIENIKRVKEAGLSGLADQFGTNSPEYKAALDAIADLQAKSLEIQTQLKNPSNVTLTDILLGQEGDKQKSEAFLDKLSDKLLQIQGKIEKINSKSSASDGSFEGFLKSLGDISTLGEAGKVLEQIRIEWEKLTSLENGQELLKDVNQLAEKMSDLADKTALVFSNAEVSEGLFNMTKYSSKFSTEIAELNLRLKDTSITLTELERTQIKAQIQTAQSTLAYADMGNILTIANREANKLELQLAKSTKTESEYYEGLIENVDLVISKLDVSAQGYDQTVAAMERYRAALQAVAAEKSEESPLQKHIKDWGNIGMAIDDITISAVGAFADTLTDALMTGKLNFKDFANSIIRDLIAMTVKAFIFKAIMGTLGGTSIPSGGGGDGGGGIVDMSAPGYKFAKGGIMGSSGSQSLGLKKYANGGIANSPQLALFGEGSTPEAYVPLPDGRTIPVTMKSGGGSSNTQVNIINQSGNQVDGDSSTRFDGEKMIIDVVLKNLTTPSPMREAVKGVR